MRAPWRRRPAPDPALAAFIDAVREHRPVLVHPCGCMPCPEHAAAQAARDRARAGRAAWEARMRQEMNDK
jgi:hypothetical protein